MLQRQTMKRPFLTSSREATPHPVRGHLVTGAIIGIVHLLYCVRSGGMRTTWGETGCYHWGFYDRRAIEPIPMRGRLGLFEVEIPELEEVLQYG